MNLFGLILIVLVLVLIFGGGLPSFGYHTYGWYPSGGAGLILFILLILLLLGRL